MELWYPTMIIIHLYGALTEVFPAQVKAHASSVWEALSSLSLYDAKGRKFEVAVDGFASMDALQDQTDITEIHVRPVLSGGGGRVGLAQVVIGALMIGLAIASGGMSLAGTFAFGISNASLALSGAMMMLGGVIAMLSPQPNFNGAGTSGAEERSKYLASNGNTVAIGTHIPIILGRCRAEGHYLSFDVDSTDLNTAPASWYASTFTDFSSGNSPPLSADESENSVTSYFLDLTEGVITFSPTLSLTAGEYELTMLNNTVIRVLVNTTGATSYAQVAQGGEVIAPQVGTLLIFNRTNNVPELLNNIDSEITVNVPLLTSVLESME